MYEDGLNLMMGLAVIGVLSLVVILAYFGVMGGAYILGVPFALTVETINGDMYVKHHTGYYKVDTSVVYQHEAAMVTGAASAEKEAVGNE